MKIIGMLMLFALFGTLFSSGDEKIALGKQLVESRTGCENLSEEQLEEIGEYLMELRHPGVSHEYMDRMMGREGSESLKNAHIQMAQVLYCGNTTVPITYGGMMGMGMMGDWGAGMMGRGSYTPYEYGMMNYGYQPAGISWNIMGFLVIILLVGLIIAVYTYAWQKFKEARMRR